MHSASCSADGRAAASEASVHFGPAPLLGVGRAGEGGLVIRRRLVEFRGGAGVHAGSSLVAGVDLQVSLCVHGLVTMANANLLCIYQLDVLLAVREWDAAHGLRRLLGRRTQVTVHGLVAADTDVGSTRIHFDPVLAQKTIEGISVNLTHTDFHLATKPMLVIILHIIIYQFLPLI